MCVLSELHSSSWRAVAACIIDYVVFCIFRACSGCGTLHESLQSREKNWNWPKNTQRSDLNWLSWNKFVNMAAHYTSYFLCMKDEFYKLAKLDMFFGILYDRCLSEWLRWTDMRIENSSWVNTRTLSVHTSSYRRVFRELRNLFNESNQS